MSKLNKKAKKGFTLVELVVVIAIIAILGAVSVVGYFAFIEKAHLSNDTSLVTQMNNVLQAEEVTEGKNKTFFDVVNDVDEHGVNLENLKAESSGHEIVWNQMTDRFVLLDEKNNNLTNPDEEITSSNIHNYWKVYKEVPTVDKQTFSIGLHSQSTNVSTVNTVVGLDVLEKINVSTINYSGPRSVIIRSNYSSTTINIENPEADVTYYGLARNMNVIQSKHNSVNIFGELKDTLKVIDGKAVINEGSKIKTVFAEGEKADIEIKRGAEIVNISGSSKEVVDKIKNETEIVKNDYPTNTFGAQYFGGGLGTQAAPYLIKTSKHFFNGLSELYSKPNNETVYVSLNNDITLNEFGNRYSVTDNIIKDNHYKFAAKGLKNTILEGNNHTIRLEFNANDEVKVFAGINNSTIQNLKIDNVNNNIIIGEGWGTNILDNVDLLSGNCELENNYGLYYVYSRDQRVTFKNCDISVDGLSKNLGKDGYNAIFVGYTYGNIANNITIENCTYSGNFKSGKTGLAVGNNNNDKCKVLNVDVKNFINKGTIETVAVKNLTTYTDGKPVNPFIAVDTAYLKLTYDGIEYTNLEDIYKIQLVCENNGSIVIGRKDATLAISCQGKGETFTVTKATDPAVTKYVIKITAFATLVELNGTNQYHVTETIDAANFGDESTITSAIKKLDFVDSKWLEKNSGGTTTNEDNPKFLNNNVYTATSGTSYYIIDENYTGFKITLNGNVRSASSISVTAYVGEEPTYVANLA